MRRFTIKIILAFVHIFLLYSIISAEENRIWSAGSAYLLPAGNYEMGLFQPLRYGLSESMELSTHPLTMLLAPNISLKKSWNPVKDFVFSTQHDFFYPTLLLRTISREGTGGIITPEFDIPHMFSIYNGVILSKSIFTDHLVTVKAGLNFAIKTDDLDDRTTIDFPLVYSRLAIFYNNFGFRGGCDLTGKLFGNLHYLTDFDLFVYPGADDGFALENKGLLIWNKSEKFQIAMGYKLIYGKYPFGDRWHLITPVFDFQWALRGKK